MGVTFMKKAVVAFEAISGSGLMVSTTGDPLAEVYHVIENLDSEQARTYMIGCAHARGTHRGNRDRLQPLIDEFDEVARHGFLTSRSTPGSVAGTPPIVAPQRLMSTTSGRWSCGKSHNGANVARPGTSKLRPTLPPRSKRPAWCGRR